MKTIRKKAAVMMFLMVLTGILTGMIAFGFEKGEVFYYSFGNDGMFSFVRERQYQNTAGFYGEGALPDFEDPDLRPWVNDPYAMTIKEVIFHWQITRIGDNTCKDMNELLAVTLYPSLLTISKTAFSDCKKLQVIKFQGKPGEWRTIMLRSGIDMNTDLPRVTVVFPDGTKYPHNLLNGDYTAKLDNDSYTFSAARIRPGVTVTDQTSGQVLIENRDYTVAYSSNYNAGTGVVTITGKGDFRGAIERYFKIKKRVENVKLSAKDDKIRLGESIKISPAKGDKEYYKLKITKNKKAGEVTSAGNYVKALKIGTFKVKAVARNSENCTVKSNTLEFSVVPAAPASLNFTAKDGYTELTWRHVDNVDGYYIIRDNKKIKTAGKGDIKYVDKKATKNGRWYEYEVISFSKTAGYLKGGRIRRYYYLSRAKLKKVSAEEGRRIKVTWNTNAKSHGYVVQISSDDFKNDISYVRIGGSTASSHTFRVTYPKGTKVKARVRSYYYKNNNYYYSTWSKTKSTVCK